MPVADGTRTRTRTRTQRRFARRQWARRWLTWRYVLAAVLLVGAIGFAGYAVYFSSWMRVETTEVVGTSQLTDDQVREVADVPEGEPLARVDLDAIEVRVRSLAIVRSVEVSRTWPHEVRIAIEERTPIAVVDRGGSITQLDRDGVTFGSLTEAPPGLPRVETGAAAESEALAEAAEVISALPDEITGIVDHVEVQSVDQVLLELRDGREVRWGSAEQSEDKADVLLALLSRKAEVYDVSVPSMPTTR